MFTAVDDMSRITLIYEHGKKGTQEYTKTVTEANLFETTRNELTDVILKNFIRTCEFYVGNDEELYFEKVTE